MLILNSHVGIIEIGILLVALGALFIIVPRLSNYYGFILLILGLIFLIPDIVSILGVPVA